MRNSIFHRVSTRHKGGTGGRTGRTDQKPLKAGALAMQFIQIRSLNPRITMLSNRTVPLVIRDHKNDIGLGPKG